MKFVDGVAAAWRVALLLCAGLGPGVAVLPPAAGAQTADWQSVWDSTVAAATKEGKVACGCPQHPGSRQFLTAQWQKDHPGITLVYTPAVQPAWPARVAAEREAGTFLWDVYFSGPGPGIYRFAHENALAPLLPALILPDVKDPVTWGGWDNAFFDIAKARLFSFWSNLSTGWYNPALVPPDKVKAAGMKVLMDPAYKDKIVWWDPRVGGSGINFAFFLHRKFGDQALRTVLVDQNAIIVADPNSMVTRMVRGTAAISLGPDLEEPLTPYKKEGASPDLRRFGDTGDVAMLGSGYGIAGIFNRAPDPNAAKVFINWLLSKPIQEGLAKAAKVNSRRVDVPPNPEAGPRALPGETYLTPQMEEFADERDKVMALTRQMRPE
jgi:iron(III) transport system substrate-binding protein